MSDDAQRAAIALFDEGNALFAQQAHALALDKYRAALAKWDHPLIRFNIAVSLIRMDRLLDAASELDAALAYGAAPFSAELYRQAQDYQALLSGRVGTLEVSCTQPGVRISLDGKQWFACAGTQKARVLAGEHVVAGERDGFVTRTARVAVAGGATAHESVELVTYDSQVVLAYAHRRWVPWTIAGGGGAVALAGLAVWIVGNRNFDRFETDVDEQCPNGCEPGLAMHAALRDERSHAQLEGGVGVGMIGIGGAVAVGGIVMAVLNRPHRVLPRVEVAPTSGGGVVRAGFDF